jgi:hypothetical protein
MRLEGKQVEVNMPDGTTVSYEMKLPIREKDRVYIVGCAGNKDVVPYDDKDAEFWGVNNLYGVPLKGAKWDRWFEIHNIWFDPNKKKLVRRDDPDFRGQPVDKYMEGLAALNCPVYMQQFWPELVPLSVPYPLEPMLRWFAEEKGLGIEKARYLTNTISYEIALAIFEGFKEIEVWGVDMSVGTEYAAQRPSCEWWLGIAAGLGIKINIPPENDLLKTRFMYGFEERRQNLFKKKVKKMKIDMMQKMGQTQQQAMAAQKALDQYQGAIHAVQEIDKIWSNLDDDVKGLSS